MVKVKKCQETHEVLIAPDPKDSIVWECSRDAHDDNVHVTEDGSIWSEIETYEQS